MLTVCEEFAWYWHLSFKQWIQNTNLFMIAVDQPMKCHWTGSLAWGRQRFI